MITRMRVEWKKKGVLDLMVNRPEPMVRQGKSLASRGSAQVNPALSIQRCEADRLSFFSRFTSRLAEARLTVNTSDPINRRSCYTINVYLNGNRGPTVQKPDADTHAIPCNIQLQVRARSGNLFWHQMQRTPGPGL